MLECQGIDLDRYAELIVVLGHATDGDERALLLSQQGLDETRFAEIDNYFQEQIGRALNETTDGVPQLLEAWGKALAKAQARKHVNREAAAPMSLEAYVLATQLIQAMPKDPTRALSDRGLNLGRFLEANAYWAKRFVKEPETANRFHALYSKKPSG